MGPAPCFAAESRAYRYSGVASAGAGRPGRPNSHGRGWGAAAPGRPGSGGGSPPVTGGTGQGADAALLVLTGRTVLPGYLPGPLKRLLIQRPGLLTLTIASPRVHAAVRGLPVAEDVGRRECCVSAANASTSAGSNSAGPFFPGSFMVGVMRPVWTQRVRVPRSIPSRSAVSTLVRRPDVDPWSVMRRALHNVHWSARALVKMPCKVGVRRARVSAWARNKLR